MGRGCRQREEGNVSDRSQEVGHRHYVRFPIAVPVLGRTAQFGDQALPGTVQNLGGGGLRAEFPIRLGPGTIVALTLQTRHGPLALTGPVAWTGAPGPQIAHGIAFRDPPGDAFARALVQGEQDGPTGGPGAKEEAHAPRPDRG